ncbi:MAG: lipopolysaccharide biosynthesis protein [Bradyrhizobium sp.]|uniref:lipopolysaccharide biosynthesis protein n=1 Tax=Bradyrhizobium sp. TaxID=376 RepID=UPI0025C6E412|nr:lipopolysaccharide biosynthesis protein [Bradyrhizobium sp.]MBI5264066.1 lipopolysaccharide biosynthesis protein [Bradyrhizobium sp.]
MLIGQASLYLIANAVSALVGLVSVWVFTRLFSPHDYGIYLLGVGFAAVVSVFLGGWFRNLIMGGQARNDGTDVRGTVIAGYTLCCLLTPIAYGIARLVGLETEAAIAAVVLAVAIGLFELNQDLAKARLQASTVMIATVVRAVSAVGLGIAVALLGAQGVLLLLSSAAAYLLAVLIRSRRTWHGTIITFRRAELLQAARQGLPLTLSLTLLAIASVTDRFMVGNLVGAAAAGKYIAAQDLVRQTLMLPAMSAASAFVPLSVQIRTHEGDAAARSHLAECAELLLSITLPVCLGFAMIASHVANVVLGPEFRDLAAEIMPIIAVAVIFQILTQQYLHNSFLLSGRNSFYLINTFSIIAANVILSYVLVGHYGTIGAAWARLGADAIGLATALALTRRAYPIPIPLRRFALTIIAGLIMSLVVGALDRNLHVADLTACILLAGAGMIVCAVLYWLLDISKTRARARYGLALCRTKLVNLNIGQ